MKASTVASIATIGSLMTGADESSNTDSKVVVHWPAGSSFVTSEARDGTTRNVDIEGPGKKVFTIQSGATSLDPVHVAGSWKEDSDGKKTRKLMIVSASLSRTSKRVTDPRLQCDLTITPSASEDGAKTFEFTIYPNKDSIVVDNCKDVGMKCYRAIEDGSKSESKVGSEEAAPDHDEL
jgi:hypothetical protein